MSSNKEEDKKSLKVLAYSFWHLPNSPTKDKDKYTKVCETFNTLLMNAVIETGKFFKLPGRLGYIGIYKRSSKRKNLPIDFTRIWKAQEENTELVITPFKNKHSERYYARVTWIKGTFLKRWRLLYIFKTSRSVSRHLAKKIKQDNYITKYLEYVHKDKTYIN